jgi:glycosyltransferase involved in cell wall biosynthesis
LTDVETRIEASAPWPDWAVFDRNLPAPLRSDPVAVVADAALDAGLRRIQLLAWRDLEDPEAGGSELHAHEVARRWGRAGLDVTLRTSAVPGGAPTVWRNDYRAVRRGGRYGVFPMSALEGLMAGRHHPEGLVEVWNGMPFFSPLWGRGARLAFLHHVHAEMWRMVLTPPLGRAGELLERRAAPRLYRDTRVVTLSESARQEIRSVLGLRRVEVVAPGVDARFTPGPGRSPVPLVLSVGRLVPVKRFPLLVDALAAVRRQVRDLRAVIVGEGYARGEVEAAVRRADASGWIELRGHCSPDELLARYRQAWVVASASQREGWGMTVTEAGACGTPSVVTRIPGHRDAVDEGRSGLLADTADDLAGALVQVLRDRVLRQRLGRGALARASGLSWEATAAGTLAVLLDEHLAARRGRGRRGWGGPGDAWPRGPASRRPPGPAPTT